MASDVKARSARGAARAEMVVAHPFDDALVRRPYFEVKRARVAFKSDALRRALAALAERLAPSDGFSDINTRPVRDEDARTVGTTLSQLTRLVRDGLRSTAVLGTFAAPYTKALCQRLDVLACKGAAYHNDACSQWRACLFWVLCLDASDVEFLMPDAGVKLVLAPGDLLVFDPCLVHAVCRSGDEGKALAASFEGDGAGCGPQLFLSGELPLSRRRWAKLGSPWRKRENLRGPLDLARASFDEESGALLGEERL